MSSLDFVDALLPKPVVVLGLPLRPYSVGHEVVLLRRRNALVVDTLADFAGLPLAQRRAAIIEAADVCCQSWEELQHPPRGWWARRRLGRVWDKWEKYLLKSGEADFDRAIVDFLNYRASGSTYPPMPDSEADQIANGKEEAGRQLGGGLLARLIGWLAQFQVSSFKFQAGESPVFDMPFGAALHLYFTELELEGRIKIENARERQVREEMAGHRADVEREHAEKAAPLKEGK